MRRQLRATASVALILFGLVGCAASPAPENDSLYQAMGGQAGINRVVEGLLYQIADDERIVHHFEGGGPCVYSGDSMADVHAGFELTEADFNALVEDLIAAMEAEQLPVIVQNRLLQRLAPMRADIIYR